MNKSIRWCRLAAAGAILFCTKGVYHVRTCQKIFGDMNERDVKRLMKTVDVINKLEPQFQALSDEQLKGKTEEFRARIEKEKRRMNFFLKHLQPYVRHHAAYWANVIMMYKCWAGLRCTKAVFLR